MGFFNSNQFKEIFDMQIHTTFQPPESIPAFEKIAEKKEVPEVKIQKDLQGDVSRNNSEKLEELKTVLEENNISIAFSQDDETKAIIVKLVDRVTGEEIRQIPTEVSLKLVAVNAKMQGNFVDEQS